MLNLGDVPAGSVLPIPFDTFAAAGESITMTNFAITDVEIYPGTSMTQRVSDNGVVALDSDGTDIDSLTGIHGFSIDLGDNSDSGFFQVGTRYRVVVSTITVDSKTISFTAAVFRIVAAESVTGKPKVDVDAFGGTAGTFSGGRPEVNTTHAAGTAWNSGAIGANTLASDTLTAAKIAADAGTEIATAVWASADRQLTALDEDVTTIDINNTAVGSVVGSVGSVTAGVTVTTNNDKTGYRLSATGVDDIWDEAQSGHATAGTFGLYLDAAISSRGTSTLDADGVRTAVGLASANLDAQLTAIDDYLDTEVAAIKAKTDNLSFINDRVRSVPL